MLSCGERGLACEEMQGVLCWQHPSSCSRYLLCRGQSRDVAEMPCGVGACKPVGLTVTSESWVCHHRRQLRGSCWGTHSLGGWRGRALICSPFSRNKKTPKRRQIIQYSGAARGQVPPTGYKEVSPGWNAKCLAMAAAHSHAPAYQLPLQQCWVLVGVSPNHTMPHHP